MPYDNGKLGHTLHLVLGEAVVICAVNGLDGIVAPSIDSLVVARHAALGLHSSLMGCLFRQDKSPTRRSFVCMRLLGVCSPPFFWGLLRTLERTFLNFLFFSCPISFLDASVAMPLGAGRATLPFPFLECWRVSGRRKIILPFRVRISLNPWFSHSPCRSLSVDCFPPRRSAPQS